MDFRFSRRAQAPERNGAVKNGLPCHSFAIQVLGKRPGFLQPQRYLYYCVRCKWAFLVNEAGRGVVTAVDQQGDPPEPEESRRRLLTFEQGPCPAGRANRGRQPAPDRASGGTPRLIAINRQA